MPKLKTINNPAADQARSPAAKPIYVPKSEPVKPALRIDFIEPRQRAGFTLPPAVFNAAGEMVNHAEHAKVLARYFIAHGTMPQGLPLASITNAFKYGAGEVPKVYRNAFRLPPAASWPDVLERLEDLARRGLASSRIVEALALPVEDHKCREIGWPAVLAKMGLKVPASTALGIETQR